MSGYLHKQWVGIWPDPFSPSEGVGPQTRGGTFKFNSNITPTMLRGGAEIGPTPWNFTILVKFPKL